MTLRWAYDPTKCEQYELCRDCDTCPIAYEKPPVHSYHDYVDLKKKVSKQADEIMKLKEENTNLKIHVRILEEDRRNDKSCRR